MPGCYCLFQTEQFSGIRSRAVSLKQTDVSEVHTASTIIAINIHLRILTSTIFEWLKLLNKKWRRGQCHHLNTKFNPNPQLVQTVLGCLCTDLRSLNIAIFGMAEARGLKKYCTEITSSSIQNLIQILSIGSKVAPTSEV
jgi:hypothetical protein